MVATPIPTSGRKGREETVRGVWIKKAEGGCIDFPYGRETKTSDKRSPVTFTQNFSPHHPSHLQLPASLCSLLGRYDNPMPESTLSPQSGTMNLASPFLYAFRLPVVIRSRFWWAKDDISFPSSESNEKRQLLKLHNKRLIDRNSNNWYQQWISQSVHYI